VKPHTHKKDSLVIVYDADCIQQPGTELFDPDYWKQKGALAGEAEGRGSAYFVDTGFGPAVLRQYLRGGWAARISRDRYFFTGFEGSRPLAEFRIMEQLSGAGLPVPAPLAALCRRHGLHYSGWLMTRRITNAIPLADLLLVRSDDPELWRGTGRCIRRFHDYGLVHADLNARNILVDRTGEIYLIDFDRARFKQRGAAVFAANIKRFRRSLEKLWPLDASDRIDACWEDLLEGYWKS
jgi:3-deoxy-D-manno-octulosonic acid kinase